MSERYVPLTGRVPWKCWCGVSRIVGGDVGDNYGWDEVKAHRAEHKKDRKVA